MWNTLLQLASWSRVGARIAWAYVRNRGACVPFYREALSLLRAENILFTKIFQSLANSTALPLPPELRTELLTFTANCPYTEEEIDREVIRQVEERHHVTFGDRPTPLQSGMIALIFRGADEDNEPVILKLKRKNIHARLSASCDAIRLLYTSAARIFPNHIIIRILEPFMENLHDILDQCDFAREIRNLQQAAEDYDGLQCVRIPEVLGPGADSASSQHSHSSKHSPEYILMECLAGSHSLPPDISPTERLRYFEYFCTFVCHGFIYNTIQHTDLHAGNILFLPDGLGIIDYGMAFQPTDTVHDMMLSVMMIVFEEQPYYEIDFIETFSEIVSPPLRREELQDVQAVEDLCIAIATPLLSSIEMDELDVTATVHKMSTLIGRPLVLHRDLYKMLLGLAMMGHNKTILGPTFTDPAAVLAIEKRVLARLMTMEMMLMPLPSLTPSLSPSVASSSDQPLQPLQQQQSPHLPALPPSPRENVHTPPQTSPSPPTIAAPEFSLPEAHV